MLTVRENVRYWNLWLISEIEIALGTRLDLFIAPVLSIREPAAVHLLTVKRVPSTPRSSKWCKFSRRRVRQTGLSVYLQSDSSSNQDGTHAVCLRELPWVAVIYSLPWWPTVMEKFSADAGRCNH